MLPQSHIPSLSADSSLSKNSPSKVKRPQRDMFSLLISRAVPVSTPLSKRSEYGKSPVSIQSMSMRVLKLLPTRDPAKATAHQDSSMRIPVWKGWGSVPYSLALSSERRSMLYSKPLLTTYSGRSSTSHGSYRWYASRIPPSACCRKKSLTCPTGLPISS